MSSDDTEHTEVSEERDALEHLQMSLLHAQQAVERFEDGSKGESVAENVVAWANKSVGIAERYVDAGTNQGDGCQ